MARETAGATVVRHVQRYLAGALNEEAGEDFVLAVGRAIERGAKTPAEAIGLICREWLQAAPTPQGERARSVSRGESASGGVGRTDAHLREEELR